MHGKTLQLKGRLIVPQSGIFIRAYHFLDGIRPLQGDLEKQDRFTIQGVKTAKKGSPHGIDIAISNPQFGLQAVRNRHVFGKANFETRDRKRGNYWETPV